MPYLGAIGAPGLRFREPESIAEWVARPAAVGPPIAGLTPVEVSVAIANAAAAHEAPNPAPTLIRGIVRPKAAAPPVSARGTPPAILPDDTRPQVHAEDFLPFFQIPGASGPPGEVNLVLPLPPGRPAPSPLPLSSATYSQTPR